MVGIYIRVSSIKQEDGESLDTQRDAGVLFAETIGEPYRVYQDSKSSKVGAKAREGFEALQTDIEAGKIDKVGFYKVNRFGRDDVAGLMFLRFLMAHKTNVYDTYLKRYIDLSNPSELLGVKLEFLLANRDNDERASIVRDNLHHLYDAGERRYSGRLYGYVAETKIEETIIKGRKIEKIKRTWHIQEDEAKLIRHVFDLAIEEKLGLSAICRRLAKEHYKNREGKPWSHDKIRLMLRHCQYAGKTTTSNGTPRDSKVYEAIVPVEQWELMQARYPAYITSQRKGRPDQRIGSGILQCVRCGSRYTHWNGWGQHTKKDGTISRYPKIEYSHNARTGCGGQTYYSSEVVEYILKNAYYHAIFQSEAILKRLKGDSDTTEASMELERLNMVLATNKKAIDNLISLVAKGINVDTVADKVKELESEGIEVRLSIKELEDKIRDANKVYSNAKVLFSTSLNETFQIAEEPQQNKMLKQVIKQVFVDRSDFSVEYIDGSQKHYDYSQVRVAMRRGNKLVMKTVETK